MNICQYVNSFTVNRVCLSQCVAQIYVLIIETESLKPNDSHECLRMKICRDNKTLSIDYRCIACVVGAKMFERKKLCEQKTR